MRTVAVAAGGNSSEFEVSVKSATEVGRVLSAKYTTYVIMIRGTNWYWEDQMYNLDEEEDKEAIEYYKYIIGMFALPCVYFS